MNPIRPLQRLCSLILSLCLTVGLLVPASAAGYTYTSPYNDTTYTLDTDPTGIVNGIDVSYYQGTIDWEKVAAAGIKFAFIRAAVRYSGSGELAVDSKFEENIQGAKAAGLLVGVYVFSQAITTAEAEEEADFVLNLLKGYDLKLPVVFDPEFVESDGRNTGRLFEAFSSLDGLDAKNAFMTSLGNAFCAKIAAAGYLPMYYNSVSWLKYYIDTSTLEYPVWVARYNTYPDYSEPYAFWQYGFGTVDGISGDVDMDFCILPEYLDCPSVLGQTEQISLSIHPLRYPSGNLSAGSFSLTGTVLSTGVNLSSVTGSIFRADGTLMQTATASGLTGNSFSIKNSVIDNELKLGELSAGYYYITYSATSSNGTTADWTSPVFAISEKTLFSDVTDSSLWYYYTVYCMASRGIFAGYPDSTFHPNDSITRSEVISTLYHLAGAPEVTGTHPFTDSTASWYQDALTWAYQTGIAAGTSATTFNPSDPITRESFAVLLYHYCSATALDTDYLASYEDAAQVSDWAREAVNWCVANHIINSTSTTQLLVSPDWSATRATAAQLLYNFSAAFDITAAASALTLTDNTAEIADEPEVTDEAAIEEAPAADASPEISQESEAAEPAEEAPSAPAEESLPTEAALTAEEATPAA